MFFRMPKSMFRNGAGLSTRDRNSASRWPVRLEVELLEPRHLLSPVFFVPMSPIATGLSGSDITATVGDVNGDGRLDVISTSSETIFEGNSMVTKHAVVWYENNGDATPSFTPHTIATSDSPIPWVGVGDIDGNGTLDAVMEIDGKIYWYGNNGNGTIWTPHLVPGAQGDLSVWIADVNGDGHNDLILPYDDAITWWENVKGDGTEWTPHVITGQVTISPPPSNPTPIDPIPISNASSSPTDSQYYGDGTSVTKAAYDGMSGEASTFSSTADVLAPASGLGVSVIWGRINILSVGDINGDGKLDVISSGDGSIQWWENPGSEVGTWTRHIVHQGGLWSDVRMAFAEDINGDGKLDIISSGFGNVSWWENAAGDGSTWVRHTITNDGNAQSITVGDINGDGHPDLFSFAPMSSVATWYENDGAANPSFTPHAISFPTGPGTVRLGDLNGDGRVDAVITPVFGNSITWFMNWDGKSPLPDPNSSPAIPPLTSSSSPVTTPKVGLATVAMFPFAGSADSGSGFSEKTRSAAAIVDYPTLIQASSNAMIPATSAIKTVNATASGQLSIHAMGTCPSRDLEDEVVIASVTAGFSLPKPRLGLSG